MASGDLAQQLMQQNPGLNQQFAQWYADNGITPSGSGSGIQDYKYWENDAVNNAKGDTGYVLNRMTSDVQGKGPDGTDGKGAGGKNTAYPLTPLDSAMLDRAMAPPPAVPPVQTPSTPNTSGLAQQPTIGGSAPLTQTPAPYQPPSSASTSASSGSPYPSLMANNPLNSVINRFVKVGQ